MFSCSLALWQGIILKCFTTRTLMRQSSSLIQPMTQQSQRRRESRGAGGSCMQHTMHATLSQVRAMIEMSYVEVCHQLQDKINQPFNTHETTKSSK